LIDRLNIASSKLFYQVFNRLLGVASSSQGGAMGPAELLIALHNIEPSKCDMKTIIKARFLCSHIA
jgi:symplekin